MTNYLFCVASGRPNQSTLYYSLDFVTTGRDIRPVENAFLGFLRQKFSYKDDPSVVRPVQCTGVQSVEESRSIEQAYINRDRQNNKMVVETGWKYGSSSASPEAATSFDASKLTGVYLGTYRCGGGDRKLQLTVRGASNGSLSGLFTFTPVGSANVTSYSMTGRYDSATRQLKLDPLRWEGTAPSGYNMVGMEGTYDAASNKLSGQITSGACGPFTVVRENAQFAELAGIPATPAMSSVAADQAAPIAAPSRGIAQTADPTAKAQVQNTPSAGTNVSVKMIDAADSNPDSAGKLYRAVITEPVRAGNVLIGQGSIATVALTRNGSGWVAQLTSVEIGGQSVAVTSTSARVTGATQNAVAGAANAVSSVLGGFGRRASSAPVVRAGTAGARVVPPAGTSLTFVLGAPPTLDTAASRVPAASVTPQSYNAQDPSTGRKVGYCFTIQVERVIYVSGIFQTDIAIGNPGDVQRITDAFVEYVKLHYPYKSSALYQGNCSIGVSTFVDANHTAKEDEWRQGNKQIVETAWKYTPAPTAPSAGTGQVPIATSAPTSRYEADPQLSQSERLAQISPADRDFALNEVPRSKTYCQQNAMLSALMDCACFARAILNYRSHTSTKR